MAKKKTTSISVSQEENLQAQQILEQYHQIATNLHESKDQEQTEAALAEINTLPEGAQIVLLKGLSKEQHVDAADVVLALNELSPLKTVRKEAKRSLIQLEGAKIHPQWQSPIDHTPPVSLIPLNTNPPRFWKGIVTDTRELDEVQLFLFWEQGEDYKDIRVLGFYLDLEDDGIKGVFTETESKRSAENFIARLTTKDPSIKWKNCSLGEGRRLLLLALDVHKENGTRPPFEYQSHISLITQLVLEAPYLDTDTVLDLDTFFEDEDEEPIDLHGLNPKEVVLNFVEFWVDEDYDLAYDLLTSDSSVREDLSKDEWVDRRATWADEAVPDELQPNFLYEREQPESKIWLPDLWTVNYAATHKEVVAGWSIELDEAAENDTLPELPQPTAVYEETNRRWFWASYTLIQEDGEWRIQRITDESINAQTLSIEKLQEKSKEVDRYLDAFEKKLTSEEFMESADDDDMEYFGRLLMQIMEGTCYTDALLKKLSFDRSLYRDAASRMLTITQYERGLAYLLPMARRFPENRGLNLRNIADVQLKLSDKYAKKDDEERAELFEELAYKSLHESLTVENNFDAHMSLVDMLIEDEEQLDHVEKHLLAAKELITDSEEEAHVEVHLGEIAAQREQHAEALSHYQRVLDLKPNSADAWFDVGEAQEALDNFEEAEASYKRALEIEPDAIGYYYTLSELYSKNDRPEESIQALEQGLIANPDSSLLHIYLAAIYIERGDYQQAEVHVSKAEQINPESVFVTEYRKILNISKPKQSYTSHKLKKPKKRR